MRLASTFRYLRAPVSPTAALLALTAAGLLAPDAAAQVIITQRPTDAFIAFEGEGNAQITNPTSTAPSMSFVTMADAAASGGAVLYAQPNNGQTSGTQLGAGDPNAATATYRLRFSQAGTYTLYYRWKANPAVAMTTEADSIWIPLSFGAAPSIRSATNNVSAPQDTTFIATQEDGTAETPANPPSFTVTAANVGSVLSFTIQTRESDINLDRFIFSTQPIDVTNGSTAAFDAILNSPVVPVPEPGSAGLVLLAGLAGLAAHRRAGRGAPAAA
jgi:hypothetical protein